MVAKKFVCLFLQRIEREVGHRLGGLDLALGVVGVGGFAELDRADIHLIVRHEFLGELGGLAEQQG